MINKKYICFFALLITILIVAPVTADSEYDISATPSTDIPTRTTTVDGNSFTVDSVTQITTDQSITISTDVPDGAKYDIQFRGPDNAVITNVGRENDTTYTLDSFGSGEAGTYAVVIRDQREFKTVHPVIIPGYDISANVPKNISEDQQMNVSAEVTERDVPKHSQLDYVEIVIVDESSTIRKELSKNQTGTYTATVDIGSLDTGTYTVSVVVRGDKEVRKRDEILAISGRKEIRITEPTPTPTSTPTPTTTTVGSTPTETDSGSGTAGGSTGRSSSGSDRSTQTSTASPVRGSDTRTRTRSPTTTSQPTAQTATATISTTRTTDFSSSSTPSPTVDTMTRRKESPDTPTSSNVIQPASPTQTTAGDAGPGFTPLLTLVAFLTALYVWDHTEN